MLHFSTLFNSKFLPQGLALYFSLKKCCSDFHLYILCVDELLFDQLEQLNLENVSLISLSEVETADLKKIKNERTVAEYCWTLTPMSFSFIKAKYPKIDHLTYLDADLFFYDDPMILLKDFLSSRTVVQITDHNYAPEYEHYSKLSGKYCVQFLTFKFIAGHEEILGTWQEQCLRWCYARVEGGKYGDQKYLDNWPLKYSGKVFICSHKPQMLAPWNIKFISEKQTVLKPVFYHFHNFRFISPKRVLCFRGYRIGKKNYWVYLKYKEELLHVVSLMEERNIPIPCLPLSDEKLSFLKNLVRLYIKRNTLFLNLKYRG